MTHISKVLLGAIALTLGLSGPTNAVDDSVKPIVIGGGTPFGYYFALAGALCRSINEEASQKLRCLNLAAGGSASNLRGLDEGTLDFAVVQSDWLRHAVEGTSRYRAVGPNEAYRSIFSVTAESLSILSRRNIGAKALPQLAGRRFAYDAANPYAYLLMQNAVKAARIDINSLSLDLKAWQTADKICAEGVDAYVIVTRHPSAHAMELIGKCALEFVTLDRLTVDAVVAAHPELVEHRIEHYGINRKQRMISTFGFSAVLVTSSGMDHGVVDELLESAFGKRGDPKSVKFHFSQITGKDIASAARVAPLHARAVTYFRARGWLD